tara:strand:- start:217 stop:582 length:366 start_codon:yes stop_codon:yes gene_type:complete
VARTLPAVTHTSKNPYLKEKLYMNAPQQPEGDATGGIIPYKNKHALIGYYMSVGGLIMMCVPGVGLIYSIAVVVLGFKGLKNAKEHPEVKGQVHCWVAIIGGALETLVALGIILAMLGVFK